MSKSSTLSELAPQADPLDLDEALLKSLYVSLGEAVFLVDPDRRRIACCNPAVYDIFGYRPEELIGENTSVLHLDREAYEQFGAVSEPALEKDGVFRGDFRMRHRDGRELVTHHTVTPLFPEKGWRKGVVSVVRDVTARVRAEEELEAQRKRLQALAAQLTEAEGRERRRIAAGLHDEVAQNLAVIRWKLDAACDQDLPAKVRALLEDACGQLARAITGVRTLTFELSPPVLFTLGLGAAVQVAAERFRSVHGLACRVEETEDLRELDAEVRDFLYRAVRELLMNVVRHARAQAATVVLGRKGEEVRVEVADDGVGFSAAEIRRSGGPETGFGLFSISERLEYLGGSLEVDRGPRGGARVTLKAPFAGTPVTAQGS